MAYHNKVSDYSRPKNVASGLLTQSGTFHNETADYFQSLRVMIMMLDPPKWTEHSNSTGSIYIRINKSIHSKDPEVIALPLPPRRRIGRLPQEGALTPSPDPSESKLDKEIETRFFLREMCPLSTFWVASFMIRITKLICKIRLSQIPLT